MSSYCRKNSFHMKQQVLNPWIPYSSGPSLDDGILGAQRCSMHYLYYRTIFFAAARIQSTPKSCALPRSRKTQTHMYTDTWIYTHIFKTLVHFVVLVVVVFSNLRFLFLNTTCISELSKSICLWVFFKGK